MLILQMRRQKFRKVQQPSWDVKQYRLSPKPTTVPRGWGGQARVKAEAGQVARPGPADSLAFRAALRALSVAWELIKMSQRIMMSGARILLQEGLPLGQKGGYPSNREGTSMQSSDTAWWEVHGVWGHPVLGANSGP